MKVITSDNKNSLAKLVDFAENELLKVSDSARLDGQVLLCFVLNKERSYLLTWPEKVITNEDVEQFFSLLARRKDGEPIAYITGVKEFWSLPFYVSSATLIPRPDTETLVELVLEVFANENSEVNAVQCLDLGTGTGAIALALAFEHRHWQIDAIDYNAEAVMLAQKNANNLNLAHVNIYQSDWFSAISTEKKFDVIVANPPYIDENDVNLVVGDVRFEPKSALVASNQGLGDIVNIAINARAYLAEQGHLFIEHGYNQASQVRAMLIELGYTNAQTKQDLNGLDRITWATFC